jgi:hypothetical protein
LVEVIIWHPMTASRHGWRCWSICHGSGGGKEVSKRRDGRHELSLTNKKVCYALLRGLKLGESKETFAVIGDGGKLEKRMSKREAKIRIQNYQQAKGSDWNK